MGEGRAYLADDDLRILDLRVRSLEFGNVIHEIGFQRRDGLVDIDVCALEVVVHVDQIERAAAAVVEEFAKVGETCGAPTVCNGWRGELGFAGKGHHVVLVYGGGVGGFKVRLAGIVRFVGGEELGDAAGADEVGDGVHPVGVFEGAIDGEGGDEGEGGVEGDAVDDALVFPVGAPGGVFATFEHVAVGGFGVVVVDQTTLGA